MEPFVHQVRYVTGSILLTILLAGSVAKPRTLQPLPKPVAMVSSFYGPGFDGRSTASGTPFNSKALTAAHRSLPFGTHLRLINPKTHKSVTVEITDRGPYNEFAGVQYFRGSRDLDVSEAAARKLGFHREGVATLLVQLIDLGTPE